MKLHFTRDWLRSHIENDPDIECDTTSGRQSMTDIPDEWLDAVSNALVERSGPIVAADIAGIIAAIEPLIRAAERERIANMIETEIPKELSRAALAKIIRNLKDTDNG